jgi:hypothetical protein
MIYPEVEGRPDLIGVRPDYPRENMMLEVKAVGTLDKAFTMSSISPKQIEYLDRWSEKGGMAFLVIGNLELIGTKKQIESILVVGWSQFRELLEEKSIPWDWAYYKKMPKEKPLSMKELFPNPALWLQRMAKNDWKFHPEHPIAFLCPEVEVPYHKQPKGGSINEGIREQIQEPNPQDG